MNKEQRTEELITFRLPEGKKGGAEVTIYQPVLDDDGTICLPVCMGKVGKAPILLQKLDVANLRELLSGYDFPEIIEESSDDDESDEQSV